MWLPCSDKDASARTRVVSPTKPCCPKLSMRIASWGRVVTERRERESPNGFAFVRYQNGAHGMSFVGVVVSKRGMDVLLYVGARAVFSEEQLLRRPFTDDTSVATKSGKQR